MSGFKGRVLVINVNTFKYEEERVGSGKDVGGLTNCFRDLGFQVKDRSLVYPPKVCHCNHFLDHHRVFEYFMKTHSFRLHNNS